MAVGEGLQRAVFDVIRGALEDDRREKTLASRLLMRMCVIDGALHPAEHAVLDSTMARHGLDGEARRRIGAEMATLLGHAPDPALAAQAAADAACDVDSLVAQLPASALGELAAHLEHGAWADGEIVPAERWLLERVQQHLAAARQ